MIGEKIEWYNFINIPLSLYLGILVNNTNICLIKNYIPWFCWLYLRNRLTIHNILKDICDIIFIEWRKKYERYVF